jgi:anti-anti-sigma regulatory factor
MNVKIDTKEKFTVIAPQEAHLSVNMTDELNQLLLAYLQKGIPHVILKMDTVQTVDEEIGESIAKIQAQFYENNCSFVICNLQKDVVQLLEQKELLDLMNTTPSESEAWDIVQMEEIERELMRGEWD